MSLTSTRAERPPTAVVMNLYYTGLGIVRSLGEKGVPVIGLSAQRGVFGNFSRFSRTIICADSSREPDVLLGQLLELGRNLGHRAVLFPTRDLDLVFIDRYRAELEPYFSLVAPRHHALERCLNKWQTHVAADEAGVPTPRSWLVESAEALESAADEISFPCVLKPLEAHHWRTGRNWEIIGGRKAIPIETRSRLLTEYATIASADARVLVQEIVPGADDCLTIAACYVDRDSNLLGGFNAQKLVQMPPGFGTGCIVQSSEHPHLFDRTARLLKSIGFSGIAEVEYKWDAAANDFKLIEINPRPWDQHRLGSACGVDLMYLAYCDLAGLPAPASRIEFTHQKWIAEDALVSNVLGLFWHRQRGLGALLRQIRGRRVYAIWSWKDPLPFVACVWGLIPLLLKTALQALRRAAASQFETPRNAAMRTLE